MALHTLGTNANNSLRAFQVGTNDVIPADVAAMITQLRTDPVQANGVPSGTVQFRINEPYMRQGKLFVPNRGVLTLFPGDWIAWDPDSTNWPIAISKYTVDHGPYHLV